MPIYITATALGKLGHPEGEVALTRAAASHNVIQMASITLLCFVLIPDPHVGIVLV